MSAKGWGFKQPVAHGYDEKYHNGLPDFPPFPVAELNTKNPDGLGNVIWDRWGRAYMKVRYVDTAVTGLPGMVVAWAGPYTTIGTEATFAAQNDYEGAGGAGNVDAPGWIGLTDTGMAWATADINDGKLIMFDGSAANPYPLTREIYDHYAKAGMPNSTANECWCQITENRRDIMPGVSAKDGNRLTSFASQRNTLPSNGTEAIVVPSVYDVRVVTTGATSIDNFVMGVLLDGVTVASGALTTSTYYYTWIQIYGPGHVLAKGATTATVAGEAIIGSSANPGYALGTAGGAITSAIAPRIVGYALKAVSTDVLCPAFICPTISRFC